MRTSEHIHPEPPKWRTLALRKGVGCEKEAIGLVDAGGNLTHTLAHVRLPKDGIPGAPVTDYWEVWRYARYMKSTWLSKHATELDAKLAAELDQLKLQREESDEPKAAVLF